MNIALVHDPASAGPLSGTCPLVLAGHTHSRQMSKLPQVDGQQPTQLMVEGSTGGAGLRGLEGEKPTPLSMSVLYFDQQKLLQAYDDITVGGTGQCPGEPGTPRDPGTGEGRRRPRHPDPDPGRLGAPVPLRYRSDPHVAVPQPDPLTHRSPHHPTPRWACPDRVGLTAGPGPVKPGRAGRPS